MSAAPKDVAGSSPAGVSTVAGVRSPEGERGGTQPTTEQSDVASRKSAHSSPEPIVMPGRAPIENPGIVITERDLVLAVAASSLQWPEPLTRGDVDAFWATRGDADKRIHAQVARRLFNLLRLPPGPCTLDERKLDPNRFAVGRRRR